MSEPSCNSWLIRVAISGVGVTGVIGFITLSPSDAGAAVENGAVGCGSSTGAAGSGVGAGVAG